MSLFRRREREREVIDARQARESQAPCPRCDHYLLARAGRPPERVVTATLTCDDCGLTSRWDFTMAVPLLVRDR